MRSEAEPWWRQAQADLRTAEIVWRAAEYHAVSWHAQQAAERALKALFAERRGVLPPRTHDLRFLAREMATPPSTEADVIVLAQIFMTARYPDATGVAPVDAVTAIDADVHLEAARRIVKWVMGELP